MYREYNSSTNLQNGNVITYLIHICKDLHPFYIKPMQRLYICTFDLSIITMAQTILERHTNHKYVKTVL